MEQNDPITLLVNSNKSIIETNPEVKTSNDISIPSVEINVKDEILKKSDSDLNAETNQSIINNPSTIKTEDEECVKSEPSSPALPEAANGNRQLELSHDIIADQPNPQINVIEKQDLNSLNQAIEEAIRKATSQDSSHDSTFQPHPHAVVNSTASSSSYPMYPIMSTQSARNFAPNPSSPQVITSDSLPNRNNSQTSHRPTPPNLPQDILHIIESDFTNADGTTIDERRETELSRITEELRIKVRLSRYQRARDEMSDSETETESEADEVQIESHLRPTNGERVEVEDETHYSETDGSDVDGSGDEEAERMKNIKLLETIKVEIDERCAMESKSEDPDQSVPLNSQPGPPQTFESTHSVSESVQTLSEGLVVSLEQDQRVDSIATPAVSNQAAPSEPIAQEKALPTQPTDTSTKNTEKSTGGDKPRRRARKRRPKTRTTVEDDESDSGSGSDVNEIDVAIKIGPTTEHELKDVPAEIIELPFENVPESDLKDIKSFGVIASLIDNIVVVKGDINMGYETVLDEGSMICWQDGTLIGKIFETFGAVTEPHYSIRLPSKLQEMSKNPSENKRFSTDTPVYFVPSQSSFLFTSHIKAQPKGTDASNLYDEEVTNADEIEFSDDEAEAAYARSCRNARKAAAMEKRQQTRPGGNKVQSGTSYLPNPDLLISAGKAMIDKRPSDVLNYNDEDGDGADTDYSVLERPKGLDFNMATPSTSTSASGNNQNGNNSARSNNKRGSDSRTRNNRSQGSSRGKPRGARGSMKGGRNHLSPDKRETHSRPIHNSSPSTSQHPLPSRAEIMPSSSPATWSNPSTPSTFPSTSFSTVVHPLPANPTHLVPQYVPQAFGGFGGYNPNPPAYNPYNSNLANCSGTSNLNPASYGFAPSLPNMPRIPSFQSNNNYQYPNFSSQTHQHSYTGQSRFPTMSPNGFAPNGYQPTQSYYPPYTPSPLSTVNVPLQQHEHRSSNSDSLPVQQPLGNGIHYNPRFFPPSNQPSHPHQ